MALTYDQKAIEKEVSGHWLKEKIPRGLAAQRKGAKKFYLNDGPPYVNALPHVGHVKTTAFKDIWTRLRFMQGFDAFLQPGFDCHGLPIEVIVEKDLGIKTKSDIDKMGIEKFDAACLAKVLNNEKSWIDYYKVLGAWRGFFEPYFTYKPYYIESAWWTAKKLHEKGMLVRGKKSIHWCPKCETALAGYEVSDSYKMVTDPSVFIRFKLKGKKEFLVVWTTTPWTLPANVGIAVKGGEDYVKVEVNGEVLILAKKLVDNVLGGQIGVKFKILESFKGEKLAGAEYEPLLDLPSQHSMDKNAKARRVWLSVPIMKAKEYKKHKKSEESGGEAKKGGEEVDEFVTVEEGTGFVHTAPGHGQTDNLFGKHYGLPEVSPVDEQGKFTKEAGEFAGLFVKKADEKIMERLEREGKLLHKGTVTHSYPLCWRCKSPLIFRLSDQWYLTVDAIKEKMISENDKVKWMPAHGKEAFENWLVGAQDWCVSQQRYWGIPMPIWVCQKCKKEKVIGSVKELRDNAVVKVGELDDLHRHSVDGIKLKCECGGEMKRVPDIFNVWFDSGISPWASLGYPFQNKELFESMFPVSLICESQDQIRGWFYSLLFCAVAAFDKKSYDACAMMGWVLDEKGEKMSKSLGNVVSAQKALDDLGADALRLYYCWDVAPWDVQKFSLAAAKDVSRALGIYFNSFAFFDTYKGNWKKTPLKLVRIEDKWMVSRLNTVTRDATAAFEEFEFHKAGRMLADFVVNDFSRWFIKSSRDRVGVSVEGEDKQQCLNLMHEVLLQSSKLLAPVTPFISEWVYQRLHDEGKKKSVHYCAYPVADAKKIDAALEKEMALAMQATEALNALRQDAGVKLRWPVARVLLSGGKDAENAVKRLGETLKSMNNALAVEFVAKPPQAGKTMLVKELSPELTVILDAGRTPELDNRALYRELTRAVQEARKKNGFVVNDKIALTVEADKVFAVFLKARAKELESEVGASSVSFGSLKGEFAAEATVEGKTVKAAFSKT